MFNKALASAKVTLTTVDKNKKSKPFYPLGSSSSIFGVSSAYEDDYKIYWWTKQLGVSDNSTAIVGTAGGASITILLATIFFKLLSSREIAFLTFRS